MPLIMGSLQDAPKNCFMLYGDGNCSKVKLLSHQRQLLKLPQPKQNSPSCQAQLQETLFCTSSQLYCHS